MKQDNSYEFLKKPSKNYNYSICYIEDFQWYNNSYIARIVPILQWFQNQYLVLSTNKDFTFYIEWYQDQNDTIYYINHLNITIIIYNSQTFFNILSIIICAYVVHILAKICNYFDNNLDEYVALSTYTDKHIKYFHFNTGYKTIHVI